jgi:formiminotetrahydrofolate cyclodeaminase
MTDFGKLRVDELLSALSSQEPTPGGGTAAAVAGAMGAALVEMVAALTVSKEKFSEAHPVVRAISESATAARERLMKLAQEDSAAYDAVVAARKLPKESEDEKAVRSLALDAANRLATEVPMRTASIAVRLLSDLPELVEKGNPNAASDAGTAALLLEAASVAALLNVMINLPGIKDPAFSAQMQRETAQWNEEGQRLRAKVLAAVRKKF